MAIFANMEPNLGTFMFESDFEKVIIIKKFYLIINNSF